MADYRGVTEWGLHPNNEHVPSEGDWRKAEPLKLFDDPEARKRVAELISRAALNSRQRR